MMNPLVTARLLALMRYLAGVRATLGRPWRVACFALATAGVIGAAVWVLFGSRLLVVRSVTVTGTHLVPRSEVLAVAGVEPGTPLIRVNTAQVAARIDTIRQVRSALVSRSWPDRVVIVVRERTVALALTAPGGGYDLVDAGGVVVQWGASRPADLPLYPTAAPVTSLRGDPDLAAAAAVLGELPALAAAFGGFGHRTRTGSGDAATGRRDYGALGRHRPGRGQGSRTRRSHADSHALLRRERTGICADQVMGSDAQDPPIRDTLTCSRVVS